MSKHLRLKRKAKNKTVEMFAAREKDKNMGIWTEQTPSPPPSLSILLSIPPLHPPTNRTSKNGPSLQKAGS
jgi:hypothetical protein